MGNTLGAAQDLNALVTKSGRPIAADVTYEGAFNESLLRASKTDLLLDLVLHSACYQGRIYAGLEVISFLDQKPRSPDVPLDLIICYDVSGSMGGHLSALQSDVVKFDAAKKFSQLLVERMWPQEDRVAMCLFTNDAETVLRPTTVSVGGGEENSMEISTAEKVARILDGLTCGGGTVVSAGMERAFELARQMHSDDPGDGKFRNRRIVILSDMSSGEVMSSMDHMMKWAERSARELQCGITYVGMGEDFKSQVVEKLTVTSGSNYFSILSLSDFETRIADQMHSAFFPTVRGAEVTITAKQHVVSGVYGAGKTGQEERPDAVAWTRDTRHLFDARVQTAEEELRQKGLPGDVVGLIVSQQQEGDDGCRPQVLFKEHSLFPSPMAREGDKENYQHGGWIVVELERSHTGNGMVRFELKYQRNEDGTEERVVKEFSLAEAEQHRDQNKDALWASDVGMLEAVVCKTYVDKLKAALADEKCEALPETLFSWAREMEQEFQVDMSKRLEQLDQINKNLKKLSNNKPLEQ